MLPQRALSAEQRQTFSTAEGDKLHCALVPPLSSGALPVERSKGCRLRQGSSVKFCEHRPLFIVRMRNYMIETVLGM